MLYLIGYLINLNKFYVYGSKILFYVLIVFVCCKWKVIIIDL